MIKPLVMDFPVGTSVGSALVIEATSIGPGTLAASAGDVLTYTVTNAVMCQQTRLLEYKYLISTILQLPVTR